ncbi:MAG: DUF4124 domain-containing protein [Bacteroidota bacterium]
MRHALFLGIVLATSFAAQADIYKCQRPSGEVIFSDIPCNRGEAVTKVRAAESTADLEAARQEVDRQRNAAARQEADNIAARRNAPGVASLPDRSSPPPVWPAPSPPSPTSSVTR